MTRSSRFIAFVFAVVFLTGIHSSRADETENLILNGEFEEPDITDFELPLVIPGWSTTGGVFELWDQGFLGSPGLGSDGLGTNQHMELNAENNGVSPTVTQEVIIPQFASGPAIFGFDSWFRSPGTDFYMVTGSVSGILVHETQIPVTTNDWLRTTELFDVVAGETITVQFRSGPNGTVAGAHLDQVHLFATVVPEPHCAFVIFPMLAMATMRRKSSR